MKSPAHGEIVSNHVYHHCWPQVSSSQFKKFYESPAAYRWPLKLAASPAMDLGTAVHAAILEPEKLHELKLLPNCGFRTKEDKQKWRNYLVSNRYEGDVDALKVKDDFINAARETANARGQEIVTMEQMRAAEDMSASVAQCHAAQELLAGSLVERSFRSNQRKARPDALKAPQLTDLKTTSRFDSFSFQANDLGYDKSLAWYEMVLRDCGVNVTNWAWIIIETKPYRLNKFERNVHRVKVVDVNEFVREAALISQARELERLAHCEANDEWPDDQVTREYLYEEEVQIA